MCIVSKTHHNEPNSPLEIDDLEFHQYGIKYSTFHGYRPTNEIKFVNNAKIVSIRLCNGHLRSWPVHPTIDIALIIFIPPCYFVNFLVFIVNLILNLILVPFFFFNRVHDDERLIDDKL